MEKKKKESVNDLGYINLIITLRVSSTIHFYFSTFHAVTRKIKKQECSSVALKSAIQSFVDENKRNVCLVYLAGHTVQVRGLNYHELTVRIYKSKDIFRHP